MNKQLLTDADLKSLSASFIPPELAQAAGIFRVDAREGAVIVGRNGKADYSGIIFPYVLPGSDHPREYRLRRDRPELEQRPNGTLKKTAKYLSAPGRGNLLYFVPGTSPDWLQDTSLPVAITEGEKKALALYRLAFHESQGPRFLPAGSPGVWNWRGVMGTAGDEAGVWRDVKGPIPGLWPKPHGGGYPASLDGGALALLRERVARRRERPSLDGVPRAATARRAP